MQPRPESLARIAVRVREQLGMGERAVAEIRTALDRWGTDEPERMVVHWVGGLVHDVYTGLEKAFQEISPELNGLHKDPESWHRDLLHAMTLDLPGFRPPALRASLEPRLREWLRFRHVYRHLYSFDLRWDRVRELATEVLELWPAVQEDLGRFAATLDRLARG